MTAAAATSRVSRGNRCRSRSRSRNHNGHSHTCCRCRHRNRLRLHRRARAGFTLIEMLAIVAVLGIVLAAGGTLLYQAATVRNRIDAADRLAAEADAALNAITTALRNTARPRDALSTENFFIGTDETLDGRPADRLRFFTVSHRAVRPDQPESDVREVEFSLEPDNAGPLPFLRRRTDPTLNIPSDEGGVVDRVARGVVSMNAEYFDGTTWLQAWPETAQSLPTAVRISVAVMDPNTGHNPASATASAPGRPGKTRAYARLIHLPHLPNLRDANAAPGSATGSASKNTSGNNPGRNAGSASPSEEPPSP